MSTCPSLEELDLHLSGAELSGAALAHVELCEECQRSLASIRANNALLDELAGGGRAALRDSSGYLGDSVPGYRVLDEIHRGGQGVVYRAEQLSTRRKVAIKILLGGVHGGEKRRRRFEREVELVAAMSHPNVVTIFDSGELEDGRLYFVMEYVRGRPLDEIPGFGGGAGNGAILRSNLALFAQVCDAVNYAHLRGVIHRDLKPGNILVDDAGEPRVVDFGLAKLELGDPEGEAPLTFSREFVGTLAYASPEQLRDDSTAIDVRTDVYSLGVILYELLAGHSPYPRAERMADLIQAIATHEPRPPSSSYVFRPGSARRKSSTRRVDRDLDTIVLKALSKEPERRYQTAGDLGRDVERFLTGEPIEAQRDSSLYLLRKAVARHRVLIGTGALVFLTVTFSAVALGFMWRDSVEAAKTATAEASRANAVKDFLRDVLGALHPNRAQGNDVRVRDVLEEAAARIDSEFAEQPELRAEVRVIIAEAFWSIGLEERAEGELRTALETRREVHGDRHVAVAETHQKLGRLLSQSGVRFDEAEEHFGAALAILDALGPGEPALAARTSFDMGFLHLLRGDPELAEPLMAAATASAQAELGEESAEVLGFLQHQGSVLMELGRYDLAEERLGEALELRRRVGQDDHLGAADNLRSLGEVHFVQGRHETAREELEEAAEIFERLLGEEHPLAFACRAKQAACAVQLGDAAVAGPAYERLVERASDMESRQHPVVSDAWNTLATVGQALGDLERAERFYRNAVAAETPGGAWRTRLNLASLLYRRGRHDEAAEACEAVLAELGPEPAEHPESGQAYWILTLVRLARGETAAAEDAARRCLAARLRFLSPRHPQVGEVQHGLGRILHTLGTYEEAEEMLRGGLAIKEETLRADDPKIETNRFHLGRLLETRGSYAEAEALHRDVLARRLERYPERHPSVADAQWGLGKTLLAAGQLEESGELLRASVETRRAVYGEEHLAVIDASRSLGTWHLRQEQLFDANAVLERAVEIARRTLPADHRILGYCLDALAELRRAQGRATEAAELLRESCAILERSLGKDHPRVIAKRAELEALQTK